MIGQLITLCETVRGLRVKLMDEDDEPKRHPDAQSTRLQQFSARESVAPRSAGRNDPIHTIVAAAQKILVVQRSSWYSLDSLNLDQLVARIPPGCNSSPPESLWLPGVPGGTTRSTQS